MTFSITNIFVIFIFSLTNAFETNYEEKAKLELFQYNSELLDFTYQDNTVFVAIFVRNKAHSLPYFFKTIEDLDYDKKRMKLWIVSDHNVDSSGEDILIWIKSVEHLYHKIEYEIQDNPKIYENQSTDVQWTVDRHKHMLELRQAAMDKAHEYWSDYILFIDADNILLNPYSLRLLMDAGKTIVAPMLDSIGAYSNYWCGMDEKGFYVRTDDYMPIRNRENKGSFSVPMVHSTFLVDLTKLESKLVKFLPINKVYKGPVDDIIVFARNMQAAGIEMFVDNSNVYGYLPVPLPDESNLEDEKYGFVHMIMEAFTEPPVGIGITIKASDHLPAKFPVANKLGFEKIYLINLERRTDRRSRMKKVLKLMGVEYEIFNAVDSQNLNTSYLLEMGIDMMPGYVDPYRERALTRGEIGCFLSHYFIWQEVVENQYEQIMVLEDDIRFENKFTVKLAAVMEDVKRLSLDWDLIYIGRKRMQIEEPEKWVSNRLVEADYSYWTLGYLLSLSGAQKLLDGKPLNKMIPVDEYLPVMFDKHPLDAYKNFYPVRNMKVYSAEPLLLYPTHYTGQENYFSDTETSSIWEEVEDKAGTHAQYDEEKQKSKQKKKTEL